MRILQVITSLQIGGAEHVVVHLTKLLRQNGHVVDVVVFNGEDTAFMRELKETGCRIYKLGRGVYNVTYIPKLRRIMREYDIIHTHNSSPQLFAAIANIGLGKVLITTEHNTFNRKRKHPIWSRVDKWMYRRYERIVCISQQAYDNLSVYAPDVKYKTLLIKNGVDVERIRRSIPLDDPVLLADKNNHFIVLMVAAFRPQKDQPTLVEAIASLPDQYHLWLAGDGECRQHLIKVVKEGKLDERVSFLGNRSDIPRLLHLADVICLSTYYEGLSLSNIEGMSAGKPFVASDVEGVQEITGGAGILFKRGDSKALANIIRKLHDDSAYYHQVAERCHQRALQYDIRKMVDAYEQLYHAVRQ
jgi:hypothetical protein